MSSSHGGHEGGHSGHSKHSEQGPVDAMVDVMAGVPLEAFNVAVDTLSPEEVIKKATDIANPIGVVGDVVQVPTQATGLTKGGGGGGGGGGHDSHGHH